MFERLRGDERAIEGLPIRLVIALVVGVASLSVMMNTIGGLQTLSVTELNVEPEADVIGTDESELELRVVEPDGTPVSNATVVVTGGTATMAGETVRTGETGADGTATVPVSPSLGPNQDQGTIEVDIKPPASGGYSDRRSNTEVLVVRE